ncbi:MAG: noncanonical pyrimidine nucleotidase, YjjG family [Firmicutes bacterium]|nr:noncanonical pyrimidine nucleotidase, YjjG family [Bacillota bacterium]
MKYELILLDADGTLFDYTKAEAYALEETYKFFKIPYQAAELDKYRQINNQIWLDYEQGKIDNLSLRTVRFEQLFAGRNLKLDLDYFSDVYLDFLGEAGFILDGAEEVCRYLAEKCRLVIVTNGITTVQQKRLQKSPLKNYIFAMVTSEEAGCSKPNKKIFAYTFNKIAYTGKEKTLMVGDSLSSDIQGGYNFGIDTCWYNPQGQSKQSGLQPTYEIRHLRELVDLL